ncbi:MAG TPA: hypothetical protein VN950_26785 [Terriglobales bacterium]|nr:hypothetical protein [Terriglobales bacterium]
MKWRESGFEVLCLKGYIYIASAFETVNRSTCGQKGSWIDNDPHFWTDPPTWGICRNDLRAGAEIGDYIFFVLPKHGRHPQMIFAYLKIVQKISHMDAFPRTDLQSKRMGNKMPNGNIIVDADGGYNRYDGGAHKHMFERIKRHYVIGSQSQSRMLTATEIQRFAPDFVTKLAKILHMQGAVRPFDLISRKGRILKDAQVKALLAWLES